jgi:hypothetical protein
VSAVLIPTADALTAELNVHMFDPAFQAVRTYADWEVPLLETAGDALRVDVVPVGDLKTQLDDRETIVYLASADVVLRKKFAAADIEGVAGTDTARVKQAAVDPLVALVEAVNEWLTKQQRLAALPDAVWSETAIRAAVVHKHLREQHQFTAIIRTTYEVPKAL